MARVSSAAAAPDRLLIDPPYHNGLDGTISSDAVHTAPEAGVASGDDARYDGETRLRVSFRGIMRPKNRVDNNKAGQSTDPPAALPTESLP